MLVALGPFSFRPLYGGPVQVCCISESFRGVICVWGEVCLGLGMYGLQLHKQRTLLWRQDRMVKAVYVTRGSASLWK